MKNFPFLCLFAIKFKVAFSSQCYINVCSSATKVQSFATAVLRGRREVTVGGCTSVGGEISMEG